MICSAVRSARQEHREVVSAALEQRFDVSGENGLADQMERVAAQLVDEYWHDNRRWAKIMSCSL